MRLSCKRVAPKRDEVSQKSILDRIVTEIKAYKRSESFMVNKHLAQNLTEKMRLVSKNLTLTI